MADLIPVIQSAGGPNVVTGLDFGGWGWSGGWGGGEELGLLRSASPFPLNRSGNHSFYFGGGG